jgi:hypothetical protein
MRNFKITYSFLLVFSVMSRAELVEDFPEGCAWATMKDPLPYSFLGYGRIEYVADEYIFRYINNTNNRFSIASVADNVGLIGQEPEQNLSRSLLALTSKKSYVVAQILDRSSLGLEPIVTCISPIFHGQLYEGRPIVFADDYWRVYNRFEHSFWNEYRRKRFQKWKAKRLRSYKKYRTRGRPKYEERERVQESPRTKPRRLKKLDNKKRGDSIEESPDIKPQRIKKRVPKPTRKFQKTFRKKSTLRKIKDKD